MQVTVAIDVRTVASVGVDVVNLTSPLSQTFATGPVSDGGCVITTGLIDEVIQFDASVVNADLENIKVLGIGSRYSELSVLGSDIKDRSVPVCQCRIN